MSKGSSKKDMEESTKAGELTNLLQREFPNAVTGFHSHRGDETVVIERDAFESVCSFLRDDSRCSFEIMMDLTAVDRLEMEVKSSNCFQVGSIGDQGGFLHFF